jgi:hypothetical protein
VYVKIDHYDKAFMQPIARYHIYARHALTGPRISRCWYILTSLTTRARGMGDVRCGLTPTHSPVVSFTNRRNRVSLFVMSERFFRSSQEKNRLAHGSCQAFVFAKPSIKASWGQQACKTLSQSGPKMTLASRGRLLMSNGFSDPILQRTGLESLSSWIVVVSPTNSL